MPQQIISSHFPYLPLKITVHGHPIDVEALLDTGFDGDIIVPHSLIGVTQPPDDYEPWVLADGSRGEAPAYFGAVEVGMFGPFQVNIVALGNEVLIGRGITDRFTITLDHGQRVIVEL